MYYISEENSQLIRAKLNGEDNQVIAENVSLEPIVVTNNWIYYFEGTNLYKVKTNGKNKEKICDIEGSVDTYTVNFTENAIYYAKAAKNDKMAIYSIKLNGKDETKITEVNTYSNLVNIIDKYMYYINQNEEGNVQTYRINVNGENNQAI